MTTSRDIEDLITQLQQAGARPGDDISRALTGLDLAVSLPPEHRKGAADGAPTPRFGTTREQLAAVTASRTRNAAAAEPQSGTGPFSEASPGRKEGATTGDWAIQRGQQVRKE